VSWIGGMILTGEKQIKDQKYPEYTFYKTWLRKHYDTLYFKMSLYGIH
jgi:hypothetical protein